MCDEISVHTVFHSVSSIENLNIRGFEKSNSAEQKEVLDKLSELENKVNDIESNSGKSILINRCSNSVLIDDVNEAPVDDKQDPDGQNDADDEASQWVRELKHKGRKVFSQNDEDGALEAVFDFIGTTDKVYVEFGVEDCNECNSRYLREKKGWNVSESLLMDGSNENPEIRLEKVIFWPDNIKQLFERFKVKKTFDLLSVDTDSYDFFMLEAILEAGYKPRVIIVEYNANFEITEAKSILPPEEGQDWERWDYSTYQGMSLLATQYLLNRFSYSLVYCNKVNCIGVADSLFDNPVRW